MTIRLDDQLLKAVDGMCEARGVARSALVRIALLDYLSGRSDSQAVGVTSARMTDAFKRLQSSLGQIRSDVKRTQEDACSSRAVLEAVLEVLLYRTVSPPEDNNLGAKARAQADYAELTKRIARKVSSE